MKQELNNSGKVGHKAIIDTNIKLYEPDSINKNKITKYQIKEISDLEKYMNNNYFQSFSNILPLKIQNKLKNTNKSIKDLLSNGNREKALVFMLLISFTYLILCMFSITTLCFIMMFFVSFLLLAKFKIEKLKHHGIINFLPKNFKYLLLNKSLLDMLMDFWHLPVLATYLKLLFAPFIYGYTPEQSIESVKKLDIDLQLKLKTKGIVNILSESTKKLLLPDNILAEIPEEINEESTKDNSSPVSSQINYLVNKHHDNKSFLKNGNDKNKLNLDPGYPLKNYSHKENSNTKNGSLIKKKSQEEQLVKVDNSKQIIDNLQEIPLIEDPDNKPKFPEIIYYDNNQQEAEYNLNTLVPKKSKTYQPNEYMLVNLPEILEQGDKVFYIAEDHVSGQKKVYKSVVLTSSKKIEEEKKIKDAPFVWDNYHKYAKLHAERSRHNETKKFNFMEVLKGYISKSLFGKVNKAAIYKSIGAFGVVFLLQILVNRNLRRYSLSSLKTLIFLTTSLMTSYSVYTLAIKYSDKNEDQIINELKTKEETESNTSLLGSM